MESTPRARGSGTLEDNQHSLESLPERMARVIAPSPLESPYSLGGPFPDNWLLLHAWKSSNQPAVVQILIGKFSNVFSDDEDDFENLQQQAASAAASKRDEQQSPQQPDTPNGSRPSTRFASVANFLRHRTSAAAAANNNGGLGSDRRLVRLPIKSGGGGGRSGRSLRAQKPSVPEASSGHRNKSRTSFIRGSALAEDEHRYADDQNQRSVRPSSQANNVEPGEGGHDDGKMSQTNFDDRQRRSLLSNNFDENSNKHVAGFDDRRQQRGNYDDDHGTIRGSDRMYEPNLDRLERDDPASDFDTFQNSIQVADFSSIDQAGLVRGMHERFIVRAAMWEAYASMYSKLSFFMHFLVLCVQVLHILSQQIAEVYHIKQKQIQSAQYLMAALTAVVAGLQMKLKLSEKCEKYRRGAKIYARLKRATTYCLLLIENGGRIEDVSVLWKEAMCKEAKSIPIANMFMST